MTPSAAPLYSAFARGIAPRRKISVSHWADNHRVLSTKESAEPGRWRTARNGLLREPMDCFSARSPVTEVVLKFPIQFGKALALETPIPTPSGWSSMKDLKVGDVVFDENGRQTIITHTSEIFYRHDCYELEFSDGSKIVADSDHLWCADYDRHYHRKKRVTVTTEEIYKTSKHKRHNCYAIPVAKPLDLPHKKLEIDPYVLGVWLGDGSKNSNSLTLFNEDADFIISKITEADYRTKIRKNNNACCSSVSINPKGIISDICIRGHEVRYVGHYEVKNKGKLVEVCAECYRQQALKSKHGSKVDPVISPGFTILLKKVGVFKDKHIPGEYLRASIAQRWALLNGLMDTDGSISKKTGRCEISSSDKSLAEGIVELLRSLGLKPSISVRKTNYKDSIRIGFMAYSDQPVFSLPRKASLLCPRNGRRISETTRRRIINISRCNSVPTKCIAVDSASHLFLAGKAMVPTHNSSVAQNVLGYAMTERPGPIMVALPAEVSMNKWIVQKLNPMLESTQVLNAVLTSTASRDGANRREFKEFAGGQLYLEHAGSPSRLKSTSVKLLIVDELDEFAAHLKGGDDPVALLEGRVSAFISVAINPVTK